MIRNIGIRREDKNRWERRTPLVPSACRYLIEKFDVNIFIQPSDIRIYKDESYLNVGVSVSESLSSCDLILGIKEMPPDFFERDKVYMFFSHVIKGQPYNMPMLKRIVDTKSTLIDYEKVQDEKGRRLLFFGNYAGMAGMLDTLWALGKRLEYLGFPTPFSRARKATEYKDLEDAKHSIKEIGVALSKEGLTPSLSPFIVGFAGYGNVSRGAQKIFDLLPHEEIPPDSIYELFKKPGKITDRIYKVIFKEEDMVETLSSENKFELNDYYSNPQNYTSKFWKYFPYLSVLINGIYWDKRYPRLVTKDFMRELYESDRRKGPFVIGDISCDKEGAIECTVKFTDPDSPVFTYDPVSGKVVDGFAGKRGPVILAVDNLPAELPKESSDFFSNSLIEFLSTIIKADFNAPFLSLDLPPELKGAVIVYRGELTYPFRYLEEYLEPLNNMEAV